MAVEAWDSSPETPSKDLSLDPDRRRSLLDVSADLAMSDPTSLAFSDEIDPMTADWDPAEMGETYEDSENENRENENSEIYENRVRSGSETFSETARDSAPSVQKRGSFFVKQLSKLAEAMQSDGTEESSLELSVKVGEMLLEKNSEFQERIEELEKQQAQMRIENDIEKEETNEHIESLEGTVRKLRVDLSVANSELSDLEALQAKSSGEQDSNALEERAQKNAREILDLREQVSHHERTIEELTNLLRKTEADLKRCQSDRKMAEEFGSKISQDLHEAREKLRKQNGEADSDEELTKELHEFRYRVNKLTEENQELQQQIDKITITSMHFQARTEELVRLLQASNEEISALKKSPRIESMIPMSSELDSKMETSSEPHSAISEVGSEPPFVSPRVTDLDLALGSPALPRKPAVPIKQTDEKSIEPIENPPDYKISENVVDEKSFAEESRENLVSELRRVTGSQTSPMMGGVHYKARMFIDPLTGDCKAPTDKNANKEFFHLTALTIKMNHAIDEQEGDNTVNTRAMGIKTAELYQQAMLEHVPFHKFYPWLSEKIIGGEKSKRVKRVSSSSPSMTLPNVFPHENATFSKECSILLTELNRATLNLIRAANQLEPKVLTESNYCAVHFVMTVERCMMHGLKQGIGYFFGYANTFWDFIREAAEVTNIVDFQRDLNIAGGFTTVRTSHGRGRAFIRLAMRRRTLYQYMQTMLTSKKTQNLLSRYYRPDATMTCAKNEILAILNQLGDSIRFMMKVSSPVLNTENFWKISDGFPVQLKSYQVFARRRRSSNATPDARRQSVPTIAEPKPTGAASKRGTLPASFSMKSASKLKSNLRKDPRRSNRSSPREIEISPVSKQNVHKRSSTEFSKQDSQTEEEIQKKMAGSLVQDLIVCVDQLVNGVPKFADTGFEHEITDSSATGLNLCSKLRECLDFGLSAVNRRYGVLFLDLSSEEKLAPRAPVSTFYDFLIASTGHFQEKLRIQGTPARRSSSPSGLSVSASARSSTISTPPSTAKTDGYVSSTVDKIKRRLSGRSSRRLIRKFILSVSDASNNSIIQSFTNRSGRRSSFSGENQVRKVRSRSIDDATLMKSMYTECWMRQALNNGNLYDFLHLICGQDNLDLVRDFYLPTAIVARTNLLYQVLRNLGRLSPSNTQLKFKFRHPTSSKLERKASGVKASVKPQQTWRSHEISAAIKMLTTNHETGNEIGSLVQKEIESSEPVTPRKKSFDKNEPNDVENSLRALESMGGTGSPLSRPRTSADLP